VDGRDDAGIDDLELALGRADDDLADQRRLAGPAFAAQQDVAVVPQGSMQRALELGALDAQAVVEAPDGQCATPGSHGRA
jgi:hypothetical protein